MTAFAPVRLMRNTSPPTVTLPPSILLTNRRFTR